MLERKPFFPHVIELNFQAGHLFGCNAYLVYDQDEWILIDVGYEETVEELIEVIRQLDFPLSQCKALVATHADVDHVQGFAKAKQLLKTEVMAHRLAVPIMESGDSLRSYARIEAQNVFLEMPPVQVEHPLDEGDRLQVGGLELEVWLTPGHTENQISLRMGELLFSGDNIYRDGCVGAIDAHHGSNIPAFIESLTRIRNSDVRWLLPAHGPVFRNDPELLDPTIERLTGYQYMADFGTCTVDWPLMREWEQEIAEGKGPS